MRSRRGGKGENLCRLTPLPGLNPLLRIFSLHHSDDEKGGRKHKMNWPHSFSHPVFPPKIVDRSISSAGAFVICNPQVFFGVSKCKADFVLFSLRLPRKETGNEKEESWFETVSPRGIEGERKKPASHSLKLAASFFPTCAFRFQVFFFLFSRERKVCVYVSWCRHFALSFLGLLLHFPGWKR